MDAKNLKLLEEEIPCQWRVQSYSTNKPSAQCVAYIDARDVMDLIDKVVGKANRCFTQQTGRVQSSD